MFASGFAHAASNALKAFMAQRKQTSSKMIAIIISVQCVRFHCQVNRLYSNTPPENTSSELVGKTQTWSRYMFFKMFVPNDLILKITTNLNLTNSMISMWLMQLISHQRLPASLFTCSGEHPVRDSGFSVSLCTHEFSVGQLLCPSAWITDWNVVNGRNGSVSTSPLSRTELSVLCRFH